MGTNSAISWTDHTLNPWTGCNKVSAGCKFCYMYRDKERWKKDPTEVIKTNASTVQSVLRKAKPGDKIFLCSWSDFFIEEADQWRQEVWDIIKTHPQFIFQVLTKRPERIEQCLPADWGAGYDNVWLGVSAENQEIANLRIPILLRIPAKVRWVSIEPMLSEVYLKSLTPYDDAMQNALTGDVFYQGWYAKELSGNKIDWVVVGGESGNENGKYLYRECKLRWIEEVVSDCVRNNVPVWVKQMGTAISKFQGLKSRHGTDITEFPSQLQIQQLPNFKKAV